MENTNELDVNVNSQEDLQKQIDGVKERTTVLEHNHQELVDNINVLADVTFKHEEDIQNPHKVNKEQVGLEHIDNVRQYSEINEPPYPVTSVNGMKGDVEITVPDISGVQADIDAHKSNKTNPHMVTKEQIGLGNVDNTSDLNKPLSLAAQIELGNKVNTSSYTAGDVLNKIKTVDGAGSGLDADLLDGRNAANAANSIPILDGSGKLPIGQVPTGTTASSVSLGNHGHSNYAVNGHGHSYLPLTGGTVTGTTNFSGALNRGGYPVAVYEKGLWTPVKEEGISSLTFNKDECVYCRVGNIVYATFVGSITFSGVGKILIKGIPFLSPMHSKGVATVSWADGGSSSVWNEWSISNGKILRYNTLPAGKCNVIITCVAEGVARF